MNWYLVIKFFHILAVTITIGGVFARQVVRAHARKSDDIQVVAALTRVTVRIDRSLVIPSSGLMVVFGVVLTLIMKWPIFGFLQGASQNWLLVSNLLLVLMQAIIFSIFVPQNKNIEALLQIALVQSSLTPELRAALHDRNNTWGHHFEEIAIVLIAALMVVKPF